MIGGRVRLRQPADRRSDPATDREARAKRVRAYAALVESRGGWPRGWLWDRPETPLDRRWERAEARRHKRAPA